MDRVATEFPRELLTQPWTARLEYFKSYTMAHPGLVQARDALLGAIHEAAPNSLMSVAAKKSSISAVEKGASGVVALWTLCSTVG